MINLNLSKTVFSVSIIVKNVRIFLSVQFVEGIIETLILLYVLVKQVFLMMESPLTVSRVYIIVQPV
jgi:hypothetical protein